MNLVLPDGSISRRSIDITDGDAFKVAKGGAIMQGKLGKQLLLADTIIRDDNQLLTRGEIENHFRTGYLVRCARDLRDYDHYRTEISPDGEGDLVEDAPGKVMPQALPGLNSSDENRAITERDAVKTGGGNHNDHKEVLAIDPGHANAILSSSEKIEPAAPETSPENPILQQTGRFNLDPSTLTDKTVDELNAAIVERMDEGENLTPFETSEEAIAYLSQDFQPKLAEIATGQ